KHVGGAAARRDADNDIVRSNAAPVHLTRAKLGIVLGAFDSGENGGMAAGDNALYHGGIGPIGRRTFGCIENADPSACARTDIEKPASCLERVHNMGDGFAYLRNDLFYCFWNFFI